MLGHRQFSFLVLVACLALRGAGATFSLFRNRDCMVGGDGKHILGLGSGFHRTPHWVGLPSQSLQGKSFRLASWQGSFFPGNRYVQDHRLLGHMVTGACVSGRAHRHGCGTPDTAFSFGGLESSIENGSYFVSTISFSTGLSGFLLSTPSGSGVTSGGW